MLDESRTGRITNIFTSKETEKFFKWSDTVGEVDENVA